MKLYTKSNRSTILICILACLIVFALVQHAYDTTSIQSDESIIPVATSATSATTPATRSSATHVSSSHSVCKVTATNKVAIYNRPSTSSSVFGTLSKGESQGITGITDNGWFAFEPGVAQAANVGVFRNRYIAPGGAFTVTGNCTTLAKLPTLPPTSCFDMAEVETPIYAKADTSSRILATIPILGYVHVLATHNQNSADYSSYYIKVSTDQGSLGTGIVGWVRGANVDLNGPCDSLPKI